MYTFIFWIVGCVGPTCEIPAYEVRYIESQEICETTELAWEVSSELHRGICLFGKIAAAEEDLFND